MTNTAKSFTNGQTVVLSLENVNNMADRKFHGFTATVNFQEMSIEGVEGMVYVTFMQKGKRKLTSICVHKNSLKLV